MLKTLFLATLIALTLAVPLYAQAVPLPTPNPAPTPVAEVAPVPVINRSTPRGTMRTFLTAINDTKGELPVRMPNHLRMKDAVACLDLSQVEPIARSIRGEELTWMLIEVLDRTWLVDYEEVPDSPNGTEYHRILERDGRVYGHLLLTKQPNGEWLFDATMVAKLPDMLLNLRDVSRLSGLTGASILLPGIWIQRQIPPYLRQRAFLLEHWQWLGLLFFGLTGYLCHRFALYLLSSLVNRWTRYLKVEIEATRLARLLRPPGLVLLFFVWSLGVRALNLPDTLFVLLLFTMRLFELIFATWSVYNFVGLLDIGLAERAKRSDNQMDNLLVPLVCRTLRVVVVAVGLIFIADYLGFNVTAVVAGLGIGGLALALAAKDTVENFFGSITVVLDRPFKVGDFIKMGDIEGTVEEVGFRSTRIRTANNSVITVPNAKWSNTSVDNFGMRVMRRVTTTLNLQYDTTPEQITAFTEGMRELILQHPYTVKNNYNVWFVNLGISSLDVTMNCFLEVNDNATEFREKERLFLNILKLAGQLGIHFAFPTQTLHLAGLPGTVALSESKASPAPAPRKVTATIVDESPEDWGKRVARGVAHEDCPPGTKPPPVEYPSKTMAMESVNG